MGAQVSALLPFVVASFGNDGTNTLDNVQGASIVENTTGNYTITLDTPQPNTYYNVIGNVLQTDAFEFSVTNKTNTGFTLDIVDPNTSSGVNKAFSFVCYASNAEKLVGSSETKETVIVEVSPEFVPPPPGLTFPKKVMFPYDMRFTGSSIYCTNQFTTDPVELSLSVGNNQLFSSNPILDVGVTSSQFSVAQNRGVVNQVARDIPAYTPIQVGINWNGAGGGSGVSVIIEGVRTTLPAIKKTYTATVAPGSGNIYYLDGNKNPDLYLQAGQVYRIDVSDSSNSGHPMGFSTLDDGAGAAYSIGIQRVGTEGTAGAYIDITMPDNGVDFYYYCTNHNTNNGHGHGMGGKVIFSSTAPISSTAEAATAGDTTIRVSDSSLYSTGDSIQIGNTTYTIQSINGSDITIAPALVSNITGNTEIVNVTTTITSVSPTTTSTTSTTTTTTTAPSSTFVATFDYGWSNSSAPSVTAGNIQFSGKYGMATVANSATIQVNSVNSTTVEFVYTPQGGGSTINVGTYDTPTQVFNDGGSGWSIASNFVSSGNQNILEFNQPASSTPTTQAPQALTNNYTVGQIVEYNGQNATILSASIDSGTGEPIYTLDLDGDGQGDVVGCTEDNLSLYAVGQELTVNGVSAKITSVDLSTNPPTYGIDTSTPFDGIEDQSGVSEALMGTSSGGTPTSTTTTAAPSNIYNVGDIVYGANGDRAKITSVNTTTSPATYGLDTTDPFDGVEDLSGTPQAAISKYGVGSTITLNGNAVTITSVNTNVTPPTYGVDTTGDGNEDTTGVIEATLGTNSQGTPTSTTTSSTTTTVKPQLNLFCW